MARKAFNMGEVWAQYVAMVTKLLTSYCRAHLVESNCKESSISDTNWLRSVFIIFDKTLVECNEGGHHLANLHIVET